MSKKLYTGVNNIARNVGKMYVGVNGVARKVTKAYVGVNGVARQFFGDSAPPSVPTFDLTFTTSIYNRYSGYGIDFSDAVLDVYTDGLVAPFPFEYDYYMTFDNGGYIYNSSGTIISQATRTITETPSKVSIIYLGTMSSSSASSGTEFYINYKTWRVSNISFSPGDRYEFVIDIDVTCNT